MLQEADASKDGAHARRRRLLLQEVRQGIGFCRRGDWETGVAHLSRVEQLSGELEWMPGLADSYLGYGLASQRGEYEEGLQRCQAAVRREVWEAENYLNLARTYLLRREKKLAILALDRGLEVDPERGELLALRRRFGARRRLTFPFLPRGHFLNMFFGTLRHKLRVRAAEADPMPISDASGGR